MDIKFQINNNTQSETLSISDEYIPLKIMQNNENQKILELIKKYLSQEINAWDFCNQYVQYYNLELNTQNLSISEKEVLSELNVVASRFSDIEEDLLLYPGTYFNEKQLKEKVIEVKEYIEMSTLNTWLLNQLNLKNGKVVYNDFEIDPTFSFEKQKWCYKEDLLQIHFDNNILVDVGWHPEFDDKGNFYIRVIKNFDWSHPIFEKKCKEIDAMIQYLQQAIDFTH